MESREIVVTGAVGDGARRRAARRGVWRRYHRLIHEKAAALVHAVVLNHGFADGNKRTALYLVELLVQRSGYVFLEEDEIVASVFADVARGQIAYADLAQWFRQRLVRDTNR